MSVTLLTAATQSSILADVGTFLTFLFGVFSDIIDAVTSNPWLLIMVIMGFGGTAIGLAVFTIRKARSALRK